MADNTVLNPGVAGDTVRTLDRSGTGSPKTEIVQLDLGGGGATEKLITAGQQTMANSVPVALASDQGAVPISAASLPLPAGASTSAKQPALGTAGTASADVLTVQGKSGMTALVVDGSGVTQPVSGTVTTTPPANASTNLAQVGAANITLGQKPMATSLPVSLASDQSALSVAQSGTWTVQQGSAPWTVKPDATVWTLTGTSANVNVTNTVTVSGTVTANAGTNLNTSALMLDASFTGRINTQGQKAMAASTPVVIASDQSAVPVSGTVTTSPPANASTNVAQFGGSAVITGTGAAGAGIPRVTVSNDSSLAANQSVNINQVGGGALTEGQKAMTASVPVVIASDQSAVPVSGTVAVSNFPATQPVSAATLPLPSGAAKETGGNLDTMTALLTQMTRLVDIMRVNQAILMAMNTTLANVSGQYVEPSQFMDDYILN